MVADDVLFYSNIVGNCPNTGRVCQSVIVSLQQTKKIGKWMLQEVTVLHCHLD